MNRTERRYHKLRKGTMKDSPIRMKFTNGQGVWKCRCGTTFITSDSVKALEDHLKSLKEKENKKEEVDAIQE